MTSIKNILLLILVITSCQDNPSISAEDPSNLVVEVVVSEDNSGLVEITISADNATRYEFNPGDNSSDIPEENTTGLFTYTYQVTGIYNIELRAYGLSGRYLKDEKRISITSGEPLNPDGGYSTPLSYPGMTLVWQDEFNGNALSSENWSYEIGTGINGWGNNELQYYREENTNVSEGYLTIEAKKESYMGSNYTSSRLVTMDKQSFKYGRIDIRARLPKGKGLWPALWMLGDNFSSVGWPACGELDIMELVGGDTNDSKVHGTIHWDENGHASYGGSYTTPSGTFNDEFHVFSIVWTNSSIIWYVNDIKYHTVNITTAGLSELHNSSFFIFNVAVGGNWPGSPDETTIFPQKMVVDYVRVFQTN